MPAAEHVGRMSGRYHDVLRDAAGRVRWDRGWRSNAIVDDCRRLLAAFMGRESTSAGLLGLQVGAGLPEWDLSGTPTATGREKWLADRQPFLVQAANLELSFLGAGATVSDEPTNRLQIQAELGPNVPPWPDANHGLGNLREFGLVAQIGDEQVLVNYVTHPVIAKDRDSTLQRTIWLTF